MAFCTCARRDVCSHGLRRRANAGARGHPTAGRNPAIRRDPTAGRNPATRRDPTAGRAADRDQGRGSDDADAGAAGQRERTAQSSTQPDGVFGLEHLVAQGHRSIGYIRQRPVYAPVESWEDHRRRAAYRRFLHTYGLPYTPDADVVVSDQIEEVQEVLRRLLDLPQRPTAVFVNNDMTAIITIKAALTCGLRVPDDLSVVGFDDIPFAAHYTPGLTTIHQPIDAMGRHAVTSLLDRISGVEMAAPAAETRDSETVLFPPTLVCRESVRRCTDTSPGGVGLHAT